MYVYTYVYIFCIAQHVCMYVCIYVCIYLSIYLSYVLRNMYIHISCILRNRYIYVYILYIAKHAGLPTARPSEHHAHYGEEALRYADVCWRMLTYADVRWRMRTYADVCWRMLWRMHTHWTISFFESCAAAPTDSKVLQQMERRAEAIAGRMKKKIIAGKKKC